MKKLVTLLALLLCLGVPSAKEMDHGQQILFSWLANPEPDVAHYRIYRGTEGPGNYSAFVDTPATQFGFTVPRPGFTYHFAIQAISKHGLASDISEDLVYVSPAPAPPPLKFIPGFICWPRNPLYADVLETCTDLNLQDWNPVPPDSVGVDLEAGMWTFPINKEEPARFFRIRRTAIQ